MNEISAKEDFEGRNEQAAHDGNDVVRFMFKVMAEAIEEYEKLMETAFLEALADMPSVRQYVEMCEYLLSDIVSAKWNDDRFRLEQPREALLFAGNPSGRMKALREGTIDPNQQDVAELLQEFMGAASYTDYWPGSYTLKEFGHWLSATGQFDGNEVAEVIW